MNVLANDLGGAKRALLLGCLGLLLVVAPGCSVKKIAVDNLGNALAGGGTTFSSDDDPELVKAALPFSLKLIEGLLAQSPRHQALLLAACSGFTQFGYAFVEEEADQKEDTDLAAAEALRARAKRLYLRARGYGLRGFEVRHPGFEKALRADPKAGVGMAGKADVPWLLWTAAAWGAAISVSKDDPALLAEQIIVEALIDRALELDPDYDHGSIHLFLISYEMARQGAAGDPAERARQHFQRALELTEGKLASPLVGFAESVALQKQNRAEFESLLNRALAINPDLKPEWRLQNLIAQRRARWLLGRTDELFLGGTAPK